MADASNDIRVKKNTVNMLNRYRFNDLTRYVTMYEVTMNLSVKFHLKV